MTSLGRQLRSADLWCGLAVAVGLWVAATPWRFALAWLLLFSWLARPGPGARCVPVGLLLTAVGGGVTALLPDPPEALLAFGTLCAGLVFPGHLWLEEVRRRRRDAELVLVVAVQPGLVWMHKMAVWHPSVTDHGPERWMLPLLVMGAVVHTGLALVRKEASRAVLGIYASQTSLVVAGAVVGGLGWSAARAMAAASSAGTAVLLVVIGEVRRRYGADRLAADHGLALLAPDLSRLSLVAGWLIVGVPGGLSFFAEDMLFHALVEHSTAATAGFLVSIALNAVAFYRVWTGLFCVTPPRPLEDGTADRRARRGAVRLLAALTGLVLVGGLLPMLFL